MENKTTIQHHGLSVGDNVRVHDVKRGWFSRLLIWLKIRKSYENYKITHVDHTSFTYE